MRLSREAVAGLVLLAVDLDKLADRTAVDSRNCIEGSRLAGHRFGRNFGSHRTVGCTLHIVDTVGIAAGKSPHQD